MPSNRDLNIVAIGNRRFAKFIISKFLEEHSLQGLVVPDGDLARNQVGYVPIERTLETDVTLIKTEDINNSETVSQIDAKDPDIIINVSWSQIFSQSLLSLPSQEFLGIHASTLPAGRGGASINWSLIHGEKSVGTSVFRITDEIDDGPVFAQSEILIRRRDDVKTLFDRLAYTSADILFDVITDIEHDRNDPEAQQLEEATYRPRRKPQDGIIDWTREPLEQERFIRALTSPYPGAFTFYDGDKLFVWEAEAIPSLETDAKPGTIVSISKGAGIDVSTGCGIIRLKWIQLEGEAPLWGDELVAETGLSVDEALNPKDQAAKWLYTGIRDETLTTRYDTNLDVNETGIVNAYVLSFGRYRRITVQATFDETRIFEKTKKIRGEETFKITYKPKTSGRHKLSVSFAHEGRFVDERILHIYTP